MKKVFYLIFLINVLSWASNAFAFTLYQQYDAGTSTELNGSNGYVQIGEQLTTSCNLQGVANNLSFLLSSNGTTTLDLFFYRDPTKNWLFTKDINTNGVQQLISFDISSTTPIDLSNCGSGFNRWYFVLERENNAFTIWGSAVHYPQLPNSACIPSGTCGSIKDLYFTLGGEVSATSTLPTTPTLPAGTCDNLNTIAGAFCKVFVYLFYPDSATLTQYSNLQTLIANKMPFGYFTSVKNYLNNLSSTSTPAFSLTGLSDIPLFDTIKTGLTWILWLIFGFWVIKRVARFEF